jgi:hypothetical protein
VRIDRGLYVAPISGTGPIADRERFAAASVAAVLSVRPAAASHRSSAVLADLPVWTVPKRPCITVAPRYTGDARHSHLHRATLPAVDVLRGAVTRTVAARTVIDVARESGIEEAVVIGDAALAKRLTDLAQIQRVAAACDNWPGGRYASVVPQLLDPRSESPLESISRLRLAAAGLPAPELQTEILFPNRRRIGWVDLYWDEFGVVGEVDGRAKYGDDPDESWWKEKKRHDQLDETGLIVVRWGRAELEFMPVLVERLTRAFRRGLRRPWSDRSWIAVPTDPSAPRITA